MGCDQGHVTSLKVLLQLHDNIIIFKIMQKKVSVQQTAAAQFTYKWETTVKLQNWDDFLTVSHGIS